MIRPRILSLAAVGVLVALALSGCGRKGALDPPAGAWVTPPGMKPVNSEQTAAQPPSDYGPDGKPVAPAGPKRRLPGDWLID